MALKSILFVSILVALMATQISQAQLGLPGTPPPYKLIVSVGTLFCTANGTVGCNVTTTPRFPSKLLIPNM